MKRNRGGFESNETECLVEYAGGRVKDVKKSFARAVKRAGIEDFTIQEFRHTAVVWMAGNGTTMIDVCHDLRKLHSGIIEKQK